MPRRSVVRVGAVVAGALALLILVPVTPHVVAATRNPRVPVCVAVADSSRGEFTLKVAQSTVDDLIKRTRSYPGRCASYGGSKKVGEGRAYAFTQSDGSVPESIGVVMTEAALRGLPTHPVNEGRWCFDVDGNGTNDPHTECTGGYESELPLSDEFLATADTPFKYALLNWNPMGHMPPGIYDRPHFDVHFYITPNEERLEIKPGKCGMLVDCDVWEVGKLPLPPAQTPKDYSDFGAVEPGMGNHLMDLTGPEANGAPFTRTFMYGSHYGRLTFWEPMVTKDYFDRVVSGAEPGGCAPLKLAEEYAVPGWYPTRYCITHRANRDEIVTSLEGFVRRGVG
ncbi:hypothetical protein JIG36_31730 [Actinoplanes sp. LDG1-06]|uniref:DUF5602 domain-containing protein n=1 Tax=Paractinoplanes ovalisporus TaxID=2810368 RepID=A0ABS2AJS8_9ACTN|nr:hypothetical protein [Actinoplanes ovalisporus]MBM2620094.1 hypothetical protein [Actinoplanes ovalisporus]